MSRLLRIIFRIGFLVDGGCFFRLLFESLKFLAWEALKLPSPGPWYQVLLRTCPAWWWPPLVAEFGNLGASLGRFWFVNFRMVFRRVFRMVVWQFDSGDDLAMHRQFSEGYGSQLNGKMGVVSGHEECK